MAPNQFKLLPVFAVEVDMIGNRFVYAIAANAKHVAKKDIDIFNWPLTLWSWVRAPRWVFCMASQSCAAYLHVCEGI